MCEDNIDIVVIDSKIREKFQIEKDKLELYKERLIHTQLSLKEENISPGLKKKLTESIKFLENTIYSIENENEYNFYLLESVPILEKYKEILEEPEITSFMGRPAKHNQKKNDCIKNFIIIAKKYININTENEQKRKKKDINIVCKNCANKKEFDIYENNIYVCTKCFAQQTVIKHNSTYNDIDRINISSKYMYDRKVHFRDCIKQYQGKQNSTIPSKIYKELENQLQSHHILVEGNNTIERFKNVTKNHVLLFLKELGYSNHYENVHLIHKILTDQKSDDISYLEDKLMDDFDSLTELYDKNYKHINRKNFINTQYVLYQLLRRHKHPCKKEEFIILKTIDRKFFHDDICKNLFQHLGWNHSPFY
tara:strand:+ start:285 stop:1382 length:1098 start_codon:yes stop_codon:yes gene_type:complete